MQYFRHTYAEKIISFFLLNADLPGNPIPMAEYNSLYLPWRYMQPNVPLHLTTALATVWL